MLDTWRAAYFINACAWEPLWAVSESSCLLCPDKRSHPPLQQMLILCSSFRSLLSVKGMIHFLYYAFSRWSSGNRRRARVQERSSEVTGSNHALGVTFNLAWGPNNFSPSMIWSWRTRSNSRTGLGAELLLPAKSTFCFC